MDQSSSLSLACPHYVGRHRPGPMRKFLELWLSEPSLPNSAGSVSSSSRMAVAPCQSKDCLPCPQSANAGLFALAITARAVRPLAAGEPSVRLAARDDCSPWPPGASLQHRASRAALWHGFGSGGLFSKVPNSRASVAVVCSRRFRSAFSHMTPNHSFKRTATGMPCMALISFWAMPAIPASAA